MFLTWSVIFVLLMVFKQECSAMPSEASYEVGTRDKTAEGPVRCLTNRCSETEANGFRRDEPEPIKRRPLRQSAPIKCGGTGLPPPCGPQPKRSEPLTVPVKSNPSKGPPKTHQTAPVTCGDTKLPPPCH
ncbi:hypothetical protein PGT21_016962 [Puccinia graminis f. sp. tritici]|uniref:Secreted protein n=1 Tax=Puccinia graminis f. sp. tritici TaxID=56615 RepID=A0A5B0NNN4_PUCGR|nr:hypothetical protein PGTUg99_026021 [Puccinia graminis f. sp. tritici]KAA1090885.1 hypothetical protein PGT21_016962 [Puccinia graminis f. sp. tritici]